MKQSPLQLHRYVVPQASFTANPTFNPEKDCVNVIEQFSVKAIVNRQQDRDIEPRHSWSLEMTIRQELKEDQNFPYKFEVSLLGFFTCGAGFPSPAQEEQFVQVNGSSMLYGAAREIVRSLTCRGPWGELFLPGASFYDKDSNPQEEAVTTPKPG